MILNLFAIRDEALKAFNYPFVNPTVDSARRAFGAAVMKQDDNNQFRASPQDFSLFQMGTYDDESGRFENLAVPVRIATASDYINVKVEAANGNG